MGVRLPPCRRDRAVDRLTIPSAILIIRFAGRIGTRVMDTASRCSTWALRDRFDPCTQCLLPAQCLMSSRSRLEVDVLVRGSVNAIRPC